MMKDMKFDKIEKQALKDSAWFTLALAAATYIVYKLLCNLSFIEAFFA